MSRRKSRARDARADLYFDNAGQDRLAEFLLAAAIAGLPITKVFTWTTTLGEETPVDILRAHGYDQNADAVDGQVNGESRRPARIRDSVADGVLLEGPSDRAMDHTDRRNLVLDHRPQFNQTLTRSSVATIPSTACRRAGNAAQAPW